MKLLALGFFAASTVIAFFQVEVLPDLSNVLGVITQIPIIGVFVWAFLRLEDKRSESDRRKDQLMAKVISEQLETIERLTLPK